MDVPSEFALRGVYMPPLLVAGLLGVALAGATAHVLNRYRLSRFFCYPPLVFVALCVIYTVILSTFVIPA